MVERHGLAVGLGAGEVEVLHVGPGVEGEAPLAGSVDVPAEDGAWLTAALAFIPARETGLADELPGGRIAAVTSFITHQFVHGDLAHLGINSAWLLAFGTPVARRTDAARFVVFFLLAGTAGALLYLAVNGAVVIPKIYDGHNKTFFLTGFQRHNETAGEPVYTTVPTPEMLAGDFTFILFALGIIGTGLLAIPVLAGAAAYGVAEAFGWQATLQAKAPDAVGFYTIIAAATVIGFGLGFTGIDAIHMLVWSAVLNGIVAVPIMAMMMVIVANAGLMGRFRASSRLVVLGWIGTGLMAMAVIALFWSSLAG